MGGQRHEGPDLTAREVKEPESETGARSLSSRVFE